jgi:Protein of unknown function (DUF1761)
MNVLAATVAAFVAGGAYYSVVPTTGGGLLLGLVLWTGFPLVLRVGAVIHENTPIALAVVHAGDWLLKLLLVGTIVAIL